MKWSWRLLRTAYYLRHLWNGRLNRSAGMGEGTRSNFYADIWRCAAEQLSAEFSALCGGFCEARLGNRTTRMWQQYVMLDDPVTLKIAGNKPLVLALLSEKGLPVPRYAEFTIDTIDKAEAFLRAEGSPCVVKPAEDTGGGVGVTTQVRTSGDLKRATIHASLFCSNLLIEQQIPGDSYRLLYLDGRLIDAVRRRAPRVVGDGRSSISRLIAAENKRRAMKKSEAAQSLISMDLDCDATLSAAGLSLATVPDQGIEVLVKTVSNQNSDIENESVRALVGNALMKEGAQAAEVLGVRLAGVDVITRDPNISLKQSGGVINEVNTTPGLHYHYQVCNPEQSIPVAVPILSLLLGVSDEKWNSHLNNQQPLVTKRHQQSVLPPVILLGGMANALSVARSLGRHGVSVYALNMPMSHVRYSRFCQWIPLSETNNVQVQWLDWLIGKGLETAQGGVILPCEDHGLELIAYHRKKLQEHYTVIEANDEILLAMLDKGKTYVLSQQAGVPAPHIWLVHTREDLLKVLDQIIYPCALKPRHSHLFQKHFSSKAFLVYNRDELLRRFEATFELGLKMLITEIIPGSDNRYCSYYSYLDQNGQPLLHFTKRKLRQHPNGFGSGTYHITDWNPEVAELGLRFLQGVGLRGIGNVEFKRDSRDGRLKLIECNARFTAANEILNLSGIDFSLFVYNRLIGRPLPPVNQYRSDVHLWLPREDFWAFREYRKHGELTTLQWLKSLCHRQHFSYFSWTDPWPALVYAYRFMRDQIKKRLLMPFARKPSEMP